MSWTIDSNWFSHESNGWKPDWFQQRRPFFSRYSKIWLKMIISKILPRIGNRETGQQFRRSCLSPFLWIGTTFDFFQFLGKGMLHKQFLKIIDRGFAVEESHIFSNLIDISYPFALSIFKECIILRILWSLNEIDDILALVIGVVTRGKVLLCGTGVHRDAKKALKWFAFSLKLDISLLLIKMGGINWIFFPL